MAEALSIVVRGQEPAERRPDAEHGEVSAGDDLAARFLGVAGTADVDFVPEAAEDAVEDRLVAERGVPRIGQLAEVAPVVAVWLPSSVTWTS